MAGTHGRGRAAVAFILSGVFPGLGQLYNREFWKGGGFLVAGAVLTWLFGRALPSDVMVLLSRPLGKDALALMCLLLAVWIWSVIDAWRVGRR